MELLSSGVRVEVPFIIVEIDGVQLGAFSKQTKKIAIDNGAYLLNKHTYPNFIRSATIIKNANGMVNQYNINMEYAVTQYDDPNFLEKLFSRIAKGRKIKVSYGDMMNPVYAYREEECIVGDIERTIDTRNGRILYSVNAVSATALKVGTKFTFNKRRAKPSTVIREVIYNKAYGLLDVLPGMINTAKIDAKGLLSANDRVVDIDYQSQMTAIEYIQYLVSCMQDSDTFIQDGLYMLAFEADELNEIGGAYIRLVNTKYANKVNEFTVDIGYPSITDTFDFTVNENTMYSILYEYNGKDEGNQYVREINNYGQVVDSFRSPLAIDPRLQKTTASASSWWTRMTKFPISGMLTVRGLIRPVVLTNAVNINHYFYGNLFNTSGRYIITSQIDSVNEGGYRTVLGVMRV
jgi:hypothetical protein